MVARRLVCGGSQGVKAVHKACRVVEDYSGAVRIVM